MDLIFVQKQTNRLILKSKKGTFWKKLVTFLPENR